MLSVEESRCSCQLVSSIRESIRYPISNEIRALRLTLRPVIAVTNYTLVLSQPLRLSPISIGPRARIRDRRRGFDGSADQLVAYYSNGYWHDSAYLRAVHHGANSTLVILILKDVPPRCCVTTPFPPTTLSPPIRLRSACPAIPPFTLNLDNVRRAQPSPSATTRRINVCFQDFWLSAE